VSSSCILHWTNLWVSTFGSISDFFHAGRTCPLFLALRPMTSSYFNFAGHFCEQTDSVTMCLPPHQLLRTSSWRSSRWHSSELPISPYAESVIWKTLLSSGHKAMTGWGTLLITWRLSARTFSSLWARRPPPLPGRRYLQETRWLSGP
jgi:hypothetical protein